MSEIKKSIQKNGFKLMAFALVSTALVVGVNHVTEERIQQQKQQQLANSLLQVLPQPYFDNALTADCAIYQPEQPSKGAPQKIYRARQQGNISALIFETTATDGYSGNIELLIGLDAQFTVTGVRVLSHKETPGLGDKIEIARHPWIDSFIGKTVRENPDPRWAVKKDGGLFDQFTGATITPRAVVNATHRTLQYAKQHFAEIIKQNNHCQGNTP